MTADRDWAEHALRAFRDAGYRTGGARQAVVDTLAEAGGGLTALEVTEQLKTGTRRASVSSIYRALAVLDKLGLVHRIDVGHGISRYELVRTSGDHFHHMVCSRCGRTEVFRDAALEDALAHAQTRMRFHIESHDVILRGLCPTCDK